MLCVFEGRYSGMVCFNAQKINMARRHSFGPLMHRGGADRPANDTERERGAGGVVCMVTSWWSTH